MTQRAELLKEKEACEKLLTRYQYESEFGLHHPSSFDWFRLHKTGRSIALTEPAKKDVDNRLFVVKERLREIYKCLGF